jgi:Flp pilus assembly protein TadG
MIGKLVKPHRGARGQALVEFAITIPIIVVIVLGLLDLGRAVFAYNTLAQSARQASRTAMVDQDVSRVQAVAISTAVTLGLTSSNVRVCFKDAFTPAVDCSDPSLQPCNPLRIGCLAIVDTQLAFTPITPVISVFWSSIPLSSTSIEPIEYLCPYGTQLTCP